MNASPDLLDLSITLTLPPQGSSPEVLATITLRCDPLGLSHTGDLLTDPLSSKEREDLRWYLEEYWQWPFEGFAERGHQIEALLPEVGKRLYKAVFGSSFQATSLLQAWRLRPETQRQISIISELPKNLSLPWELLHDEQGFLVLRTRHPVVLLRRLPQGELAGFSTPFEPPLRVLLVTARPDEAGFINPRSTARELLDEVEQQVEQGTIAIEFLRPQPCGRCEQGSAIPSSHLSTCCISMGMAPSERTSQLPMALCIQAQERASWPLRIRRGNSTWWKPLR